ncbi:hypothetical protein GQ55_2G083600 [Panicum hallii var. hallii]|uniref:Uncharacterized protein n=1 Tax=Panicum hallii var. hallii TaxID=1504633 RepID=A0A2T7EMS4_9POAL|nr:hypothetical protein GQ55_2G083600 [Panicum hallii var. hallii]
MGVLREELGKHASKLTGHRDAVSLSTNHLVHLSGHLLESCNHGRPSVRFTW